MEDDDPKRNLINYLNELALDLHWSWNHGTDKIWHQLDPYLWEFTHNPLFVLQTVSQKRIDAIINDPIARDLIIEMVEARHQRNISPGWFQNSYAPGTLNQIAYFSMEYMLSEALPIYSGGLGNVSGDLLKSASDLGVPLIGVGLLYQQGYSRQVIRPDGTQLYLDPFNDPGQLPITPLRNSDNEWLRIPIPVSGISVWLRAWQVQVGRTKLLLLDSNDPSNFPLFRSITNKLYSGDPTIQLLQEIALGIGGYRLLKALNIHPDVCHLNEGHAALLIIERARETMNEFSVSFEQAIFMNRCSNVFTTHTAVGAGFDLFNSQLLEQYLGHYIRNELRITLNDFIAIGKKDPDDPNEQFNTSYLAIHGSGSVNGVSKIHSRISRKLFAPLFERWPLSEIPISYVTNGVHMPSWDSPSADKFWTETCGKERWMGAMEHHEKNVLSASEDKFWTLRNFRIKDFIIDVYVRYQSQMKGFGVDHGVEVNTENFLQPDILTIGFARRFVPYKRPNLLLHDKERFKRILLHKERPVQLVIAGKAHPSDVYSQQLIREWIQFIEENSLHHRVVFLEDYDMLLTEQLVQGVDLWINTPRRPWEACGTSGMKVLVNGGLNFSELDGWWDEAYSPEVGWTFGDNKEIPNDELHDEQDAIKLYEMLENEIVPLFYKRDEHGIPTGWVEMMRNSMSKLTWRYSANRALQEYTEKIYMPAALQFRKRIQDKAAYGMKLFEWKNNLDKSFASILFKDLQVSLVNEDYIFQVELHLVGIDSNDIVVEIFGDPLSLPDPVIIKMKFINEKASSVFYEAHIKSDRPSHYFTPRIRALANDLTGLENDLILWYK